MSVIRALKIDPAQAKHFRELAGAWQNGNRKDVRDVVLDRHGVLSWLLPFLAFFLDKLGPEEYGILLRLVVEGEKTRKTNPVPNDCKSRFVISIPATGVSALCVYSHTTGRFDIHPDKAADGRVDEDSWARAVAFCEELEGNYFLLRDVTHALDEQGVDADQLP